MKLFHRILNAAVQGDASDVHLKVGTPVKVRIHGVLTPIESPVPTSDWLQTVTDQLVPQHSRERFQKEHQVDFSYQAPGIGRFRTNVFQQRGELSVAMRFVKTRPPTLDGLDFPPILKEIAESKRGIVLIAGAAGSGKSTTMAAMLQHINTTQQKNIVTLEDPIEYIFEDDQSDVKQREIGLDTPSFAEGLKAVVRQDPDVILIGEMRDATSFSAALGAADTGHLVFSTLHVNTAAQFVGRVLDFFKVEEREQVRRQVASNLRAVICQRMVRKLDGGIGVAQEILMNTVTVRRMIEQNRLESLPAAIETGRDDGMQNFNQALHDLVKARKISEEEAMAKASNPQALEMNLQGIFLTQGSRILSP